MRLIKKMNMSLICQFIVRHFVKILVFIFFLILWWLLFVDHSIESSKMGAFLKEHHVNYAPLIGVSFLLVLLSYFISVRFLPGIGRLILPPVEEKYLSDFLQFSHVHEDNKTIETKDGKIFQTLFLKGLDYTAFTNAEAFNVFKKRCGFVRDILNEGVSFRLITARNLISHKDSYQYDDAVLEALHERWNCQFDKVYKNDYYIVLYLDKSETKAQMTLNDQMERIMDHFDRYGPELLFNKTDYSTQYSPLLSFWSRHLNRFPIDHVCCKDFLSERLPQTFLSFDLEEGILKYSDGQSHLYEKAMMVKMWGDQDYPQFLSDLLSLDTEMVINQLVQGFTKQGALSYLGRGKKMMTSLLATQKMKDEFDSLLDGVKNDDIAIAKQQFVIFIRSDSEEKLADELSQARKILVSYGMNPVVEQKTLPFIWKAQFPGFENMLRRRTPISDNIANYMHFERFSTGIRSSDWGQGAIRQFTTASGSSYAFQFHVSEEKESAGHSLIFAPTSGGKTTLMQHLMAGAMRHSDLNVFAFDKLNGMSIFTNALKGNHIHFGEGNRINLNPFHQEGSPEYKAFLYRWLADLTKVSTDDHVSLEQINHLIETAFQLDDMDHRTLSNLYATSVVRGNAFHKNLKSWVGDSIGARWFNGQRDCIDFKDNRLVTFDMTDILEDESVAGPVIHYIMHRIRTYCQQKASPHLIFIDEAKRYTQNSLFRNDLKTLLEEHRKLRGVVCLAFQNSSSIGEKSFQESVLNQCQTRIIFPNPNAKREDYESLDLTDGEFAFLKGDLDLAKKFRRPVLIKKPGESVILNVDLSILGEYLALYKSGSEPVSIAKQFQKQCGDQWVSKYLHNFSA